MSSLRQRRRPALESLESRQLLAGNVLIDTSDGNLVITGDALANRIAIHQTGLGQFTVTGLDGEQFRTPGGRFQRDQVSVPLIRGGICVSLGAGDDSVTLTGASPGQPTCAFLDIFTGSGQDQVEVRNLRTGDRHYPLQITIPEELKRQRAAIGEAAYWNAVTPGSLTIDTGAADRARDGDSITLAGVAVEGPAMINTGAGADYVSLDDVVGRQGFIGTGTGADQVQLANSGPVSFYVLNMNLAADDDRIHIGTASFVLTGIDLSRFDGGRGLNYLTGYANLDARTRGRLVNPRTTGFVVDPVR